MELKKFEAPTLAEALKVVKREMGPEAVILSTKNNKNGFGLLSGSSVEVTAAVSPEALDRKRQAERRMTPEQVQSVQSRSAQSATRAYDVLSGSRIGRQLSSAQNFVDAATSTGQNSGHNAGRSAQLSSANQQAVSKAAPIAPRMTTQRRYIDIGDDESPAEMATSHAVDRPRLTQSAPSVLQQARHAMHLHQQPQPHQVNPGMGSYLSQPASQPAPNARAAALLPRLLAQLLDSGMEADLTKELGDELKLIMVRENVTREDILRVHLAKLMMSRLRVAKPLGERLRLPTTPRMFTFVGPTGVGKTTTIAKIAAELVISQQRPVTLATTDTFKIAAVEQLQTYANILRIPLEVCPTADSLAMLAASLDPDHIVLIDTAGYGPKDERKLVELREILSGVRTETHLCVGAMIRDRDLSDIVRRFKMFNPDYLVMTKLDETSSFGSIFNVSVKSQLPLSYFTMGQRVPEDMEVATKERVADLILNISGGG